MASHLQLGQPTIILAGRKLQFIGTELIAITPSDGNRADIISCLNGSISKISPIDELFEMSLPIQVGSADDQFLQDLVNARVTYLTVTGSVSQVITDANGNLGTENYDIENGVILRSPDRAISYDITDIKGEAFAIYPVKFAGKRVV